MITAQDIREKSFEKARIGGYDMASVDNFLEDIADEITAAQKENAVLKSKMKVLVDKIEEYRANEEALNMAVLSAQKLAVQIEADARARSASMLDEAEKQVKATVGGIQEQTMAEEKRLEAAKAATARFIEAARAMCNTQLKNIDAIANGILPQQPETKTAAPTEDDTVRSIEKSASRIQPDPSIQIDINPARSAPAPQQRQRKFDSTQPFSL
ncbi:MAG: DivIVA domain-containing protein [Candidatus Limivicinus sp.]|nr:DivIVA domain-containing protein [Clostridiales bacterium]MDY3860837.1 DivIVA domain-containing protein [Candidatus Limivicinus sp.]